MFVGWGGQFFISFDELEVKTIAQHYVKNSLGKLFVSAWMPLRLFAHSAVRQIIKNFKVGAISSARYLLQLVMQRQSDAV